MKQNTNIQPYWDLIERIINESDIVIEVLDSRMIELSRNEEVERLVKEIKRPLIFVVNKSDLVKKDYLKKSVEKLRNKGEVVFISTKKKETIKILLYKIKKVFKKYGKSEKIEYEVKNKPREAIGAIVVGVLGYPNVGKSSIINALSHKKKTKVSKKSGTTHGIHWIKATNEIKLIDSPGVIPLSSSDSLDDEIRYGLIGAKDSERLKNPELVAHSIIKLFKKKNKNAFEKHYEINLDSKDVYEIIEEVGRKKSYLIKGGRVDENRTIKLIVKDWQDGKLRI